MGKGQGNEQDQADEEGRMKQLICLYGPSGVGKTSLVGTFATGLFRATGKRTRLYNRDGGVASIGYLQSAGIADIWDMGETVYPFEALLEASQGAWPADVADPTSRLEPPTLVRYIAECDVCKLRSYDQDKACTTTHVKCTKCSASIAVRPRRVFNPTNDLSKLNIGVVVFEGLTGFSDSLMANMSDRSAKGEKIGEDVAVRFKDNQLDVGGVSRSAYGIAQRRMQRAVEASRNIPGVDYVIWTAHKDRGEDDIKRTPVFGPKLVGHAATDDAPRWFGPCFSITSVPGATGKLPERRMYLSNYFETWNQITSSVEHICNSRIPTSVLDGVPEHYVFDKARKGEFGAETLLWDVIKLIEAKQAEAATLALKGTKKAAV